MDYLIIAVVVFVALSPLISMLPNGRRLKQAKMRQSALSLGMLVAFSDIPKASKYDKTEKGICYRLLTHDRKRAIVAGVHKFVRSSDTWVSAGPVSELQISLLKINILVVQKSNSVEFCNHALLFNISKI